MIFRELSNAVFRFVLRCAGAEIDGGCSNTPSPPPAGGGKSRGPSGRGLNSQLFSPKISNILYNSRRNLFLEFPAATLPQTYPRIIKKKLVIEEHLYSLFQMQLTRKKIVEKPTVSHRNRTTPCTGMNSSTHGNRTAQYRIQTAPHRNEQLHTGTERLQPPYMNEHII